MSNADGSVLPKPGIPKTLGILNIIFSVLLVLLTLCSSAGLLIMGPAAEFVEKKVQQEKAQREVQEKAEQKAFDDRVEAAKTDEEKKAIEQERANAIANRPVVPTVDMTAAMETMKDPTVRTVTIAGIISGLILQVVLLISGIGLIRLAPWGRSLAIAWGWLQILQVAVLLAASIFVVLPITKPITDKQIEAMEKAAKAPGANPMQGSTAKMTKTMAELAVPMTVAQSLSGMIYPVVLIILLGTAGARAAFVAGKPRGQDVF